MGRFVPISYTINVAEKSAPVVPGAKAYYDGKQCWQYKVVYDRPGSYTYTLPSNAICVRTVIVGGGGKPKCGTVPNDGSGCNSAAGAGGAYSDKAYAVTGGTTTLSLVVGRQEGDTTVACNGVNVHTAGGAAGCIPGVATGGDWNSRGGCPGYTCNDCGSSYSHHCGSCKCFSFTNCCGYCIVYQFDPAGTGSVCCEMALGGGASAGSPLALCGGASWCVCGSGGGSGYGGTAAGGAGIGDYCYQNCAWHYNCCICICFYKCDGRSGYHDWCTNYPGSAQGGGGTGSPQNHCRSWASQNCVGGVWKGGDGGAGGRNKQESQAWTFEWGYNAVCSYPFGSVWCQATCTESCAPIGPVRHDWWDIRDICGSGSPGVVGNRANCIAMWGTHFGTRPVNAGEGAGTGAIVTTCCNPMQTGQMIGSTASSAPLTNWTKLCSLGLTGQCDQAWHMVDALFPFFITCAGTLGGSGGVNWCGYTSKAGKGGGGGHAKCQFLCICWGGAFDCCNQTASTPLAFPPCLLDQLVSNAGTGMAIIYYREA